MIKLADLTSEIRAKIIVKTYKKWLKPQSKLIDIGCGTGVVGFEIAQSTGLAVYGCDIQNYLLRNIKFKKIEPNNRLPYVNNYFELALLNDVLHHIDYNSQMVIISESLRIAKETLVFELKPTTTGRILDFLLNKIHNPKMPIPFAYRSEKVWEKLFRKNKISYEKKRVLTPFFYPFSHVAYKLRERIK